MYEYKRCLCGRNCDVGECKSMDEHIHVKISLKDDLKAIHGDDWEKEYRNIKRKK